MWGKQRAYDECTFVSQHWYGSGWTCRYDTFANIDAAWGNSNTGNTESDADEGRANANSDQDNTHSYAYKSDADSYPCA